MTRVALGIGIAIVALSCTSSGKQASDSGPSQSLAEALSTGVKFDRGLFKKGPLPNPDSAAQKVKLTAEAATLGLKPGNSSIMSLDVDDPDDSTNPVQATLVQFEDSDSHVQVRLPSNARKGDGGTGQNGVLHIENGFTVSKDICKNLCNRHLSSRLFIAVMLENGNVSQHAERDLDLDCTKDGDAKKCTSKSGNGSSTVDAGQGSGRAKDAGSAARRDAGGAASGMGGSSGEGGTLDAGNVHDAGTTRDAGSKADAGNRDAASDAATATPPQIGPISPDNTTEGTQLTLTISGTGFISGAVAYVDGQTVPTKFVSGTSLEASVSATSTAYAGSLAVYVENVQGDTKSRSNVLYLVVNPATGAPVIYDYSPDNGVAGDKILIISSNLAGQTLDIKDTNGRSLTAGTLSTISWPTVGTVDTVEVTLPSSIATGPITIGNSKGSFKGKIFTVGRNLTRTSGTTLDSSTQYNTSNWARASGGDNSLATSFFTAHGDCATLSSCTTKPWFKITFPSAQTVARIAIRGNREYASGYDFLRGTFEVLDTSQAVLWTGTYDLPAPDRDLDITLPTPIANAFAVKFSGLDDESDEPGFSELEVFGP
jgi:hypothetical protein